MVEVSDGSAAVCFPPWFSLFSWASGKPGVGRGHSLMEPGLGWNPQPHCSSGGCKMPGPLLLYNLPWLPRTQNITSTLLSLESEASQVIFLLLLITPPSHTGQGGIRSVLFPSTSSFTGIAPPPFPLPLSKSCSSFTTQHRRPPPGSPELPTSFSVLFAAEMSASASGCPLSVCHSTGCGMGISKCCH